MQVDVKENVQMFYLQASPGPSINSYAKGVFLNNDCNS